LNDIIWRALTRASVSSLKESPGLFRSDGKRPDGLTLIPWRGGKCVAWDVTVTDTLAKSFLHATTLSAGGAAELAATRKSDKYRDLPSMYQFVPIAIETFGPMNVAASEFLTNIGRKTSVITGERREISFLRQRISMALQRFNAVCFRGSFPGLVGAEYEEASINRHVSYASSAVESCPDVDMLASKPTLANFSIRRDVSSGNEGSPDTCGIHMSL